MKINRNNYESFFMDYIEGNLQENMIDQFLDFLNQNPDLKEELHLFEEVNLSEEQVVFQGKKQLHKSVADETRRLENSIVAYLEGDWDTDENKVFETYIASNPELKKEYDLFAQTHLTPDSGIKFPEKRKLYRKSGATIAMNWVVRAAAIIVFAWGINSIIQTQNAPELQKTKTELAKMSPKTASTVKKPDSEKPIQNTTISLKNKLEKVKDIQEQTKLEPEETQHVNSNPTKRDLTMLAQITPIIPKLNQEPTETQLAFSRSIKVMKINKTQNVMSVEEFLANRVQKISKEGLFSAQRIARMGLNLVSEISGERIGYQVKNGKITSVNFESKLMAFSIPLEKK